MSHTPSEIHYVSARSEIEVTWGDGHRSAYPTRYLRGWCPCASCQGHFAAEYTFIENDGPELVDARPVGGYGVQFVWGDGHEAGIYTFRELRAMCPSEGGDQVASSPVRRRRGE